MLNIKFGACGYLASSGGGATSFGFSSDSLEDPEEEPLLHPRPLEDGQLLP